MGQGLGEGGVSEGGRGRERRTSSTVESNQSETNCAFGTTSAARARSAFTAEINIKETLLPPRPAAVKDGERR